VDSVAFTLDGKPGKTEGTPPYSLAGDSGGDFNAWTPSLGEHQLTAVAKGAGKQAELTVRFRITQ
jgi:hypothetical protein